MSQPVFAVIGGSGFYQGFEQLASHTLDTPWGETSAPVIESSLEGRPCFFLARHGARHHLLPHEVPYRANIFALKRLGVTHVLSVSAVGSLQEEIAPGHVVLPDQYIDLTRRRASTFFGDGLVVHVAFANPVCPVLWESLRRAGEQDAVPVHLGGTYVCMDGPQFSTRAESHMYRAWGARVIGMTNLPEAKLAREAELHYAALAMPSDYDCWREDEEHVSVDSIMELLGRNVDTAKRLIRRVLAAWDDAPSSCDCAQALHRGLMCELDNVGEQQRALLGVLAPDLLT